MKFAILSMMMFASIYSAQAHEDDDWRLDEAAYRSVRYLPRVSSPSREMHAARVDMNFFKQKLAVLTGNSPFNGKAIKERGSNENLNLTRAFLAAEYQSLGFTVSYQKFGNGINFVAEKAGTQNPKKVLILSSHIDSVGNNGANDNGTGTIGLLAVAKELAKNNYPNTVRILGFDREEVGLVGSQAYVASLGRTETILGDIQFEMMGVNGRNDGAFHVIDCDKRHSVFLTETMQNAIAKLNLPLTISKACTDRSDHAAFWKKGLPAVVISENFFGGDSDPCYHSRCDVMDNRLKYNYMGAILEATLDTTETILKK